MFSLARAQNSRCTGRDTASRTLRPLLLSCTCSLIGPRLAVAAVLSKQPSTSTYQVTQQPARGGMVARSVMSQNDGRSMSDEDMGPEQAGRRALKVINELTKWLVSTTAVGVILWRHDIHVMWCILGSIVNVCVCKVLKQLIKAERPGGAAKEDHGMPSSHASSLGYLSVYTASSLLLGAPQLLHHATATAVMALGLFMTWLRVATGYHTYAQVFVGFILGAGMAFSWQQAGLSHILVNAHLNPLLVKIIYSLSIAAAAGFAIKSLMGASKDMHRLKSALS